jgi:hypothetical protein
MRGDRLKIMLSGMVAGDPHQGGATWAVLQYFFGLRDLGHDVLLVEPVADDGGSWDPSSDTSSYFRSLSLPGGRAALLRTHSRETVGATYAELVAFAAEADVLINISGMLEDERLLEQVPIRAFLDLDPGFNQVWYLTGADMGFDRHTHFASVGQLLGSRSCAVPTCGRRWIPTLPPVTLDRWPLVAAPRSAAFTSIGHWRSYGSMEHEGIHYGQRAHSLRELIELPGRVGTELELALGIHPDEVHDLAALRRNGWKLVDPAAVAATPDRYAAYIRGSEAELGIAKSGYVNSRSGWFSDRSACYLASGRPVVAQETGFGEVLPLGEGLMSFTTLDEAAAAIDEVRGDPARHGGRARELAEDLFDSRAVLGRLLLELASPPSSQSPLQNPSP